MRSPLGPVHQPAPVPYVRIAGPRVPAHARRTPKRRCTPWAAWARSSRSSTAPQRTSPSTGSCTARPSPRAKEDRIEVTSHAALDLWNKPNKFMPRQEFVETFQQHVDLTGEACWVIARDKRFRSRWSCGRCARTAWIRCRTRTNSSPATSTSPRTARRCRSVSTRSSSSACRTRWTPTGAWGRAVGPRRPRRHPLHRRVEPQFLPELGRARRHHRGRPAPVRHRVRRAGRPLGRAAPRRRPPTGSRS